MTWTTSLRWAAIVPRVRGPASRDSFSPAVLMLTALLLVAQGFVINRSAGIEYPLWSPPPPE